MLALLGAHHILHVSKVRVNRDKAINTCRKDEKSVQSFGWQSSVKGRFEDVGVNGTIM
jgi:hypothetical protein